MLFRSLQLHLFNGETFDIHLPFPMAKIYSSSEGLIMQRKVSPVEFFSDLNTSSVKINPHFNANDSEMSRERSLDVKLWLDETNDEQQMQFEVSSLTLVLTHFFQLLGA